MDRYQAAVTRNGPKITVMAIIRPAALLLALAAATPQQAPPAAPATGAITGVVVDGASGSAVAGAVVSLRAPAGIDIGPQPSQLADDKGRFAFVNLPASPGYTIAASKSGYLSGGYGRDTEPSDPLRLIPLKENEWVGNLRVPIWKPGSIAGTVRDENDEPVVGVFVRALMRYRLQGRDELAVGPMTVTDDRGAYRMSGLTPGRYVIQVPSVQASMSAGTAAPPPQARHDGILEMDDTSRLVIGRYPLPPPMSGGRPMAYPIAFHPTSSAASQATTIDLTYGDDRANVDVALTPMPAARVSGVVDAPPEALPRLTLRLLPAGLENLGHGSEAATALVGPSGQFTFLNVPASGRSDEGLEAPLRDRGRTRPARLARRRSIGPSVRRHRHVVRQDDGADRHVAIRERTGDRRLLPHRVLDGRFAVAGRFVPKSLGQTGTDGRFTFADLPAGEYFVAALMDLDPVEWQTPAFLEQIALEETRLMVAEGERKVQDLRIR